MLFIIAILGLWGGVEASSTPPGSPTKEQTAEMKTYYVKLGKDTSEDPIYITPEKVGKPDTSKEMHIFPTMLKRINLRPTNLINYAWEIPTLQFNGTSVTTGGSWAKIPGLTDTKYKVKYIDGDNKVSDCYATVDVGAIKAQIQDEWHLNTANRNSYMNNLQSSSYRSAELKYKDLVNKCVYPLQIEGNKIKAISTTYICKIEEDSRPKTIEEMKYLAMAVFYFILGCLDFSRETNNNKWQITNLLGSPDIYPLFIFIEGLIQNNDLQNIQVSKEVDSKLATVNFSDALQFCLYVNPDTYAEKRVSESMKLQIQNHEKLNLFLSGHNKE